MKKELFDYLMESVQEAADHAEGRTFLKTTLYKLDSSSKPWVWSIWVDGDDTEAVINIEHGLVDGKKTLQLLPITQGKNLGKANATTPYTQAVAEARAKVELQLRGGYVDDLANVKESGTLGSGIKKPMLAHKYDPTGKQNNSKTLDKMKIRGQMIHVQPKYDGNRCLIRIKATKDLTNCEAIMYTRKGDIMHTQYHHIIHEVACGYGDAYFADGFDPDSPEIVLDGELFSTTLPFNELNGLLNSKKEVDPHKIKQIDFRLYDVMSDKGYRERYEFLKYFVEGIGEERTFVHLVPSYEIEATDENIQEKLEEFLAEGHEGLMIRTLETPYENKRTWQLVKAKLFEDSEFEILDLEPDAMGRLGYFIMKMDEPVKDRDGKLVETFKAGLKDIDHETGKRMLNEKHKYVGKMATVEYFGRDIRPRFPKFKALREA